MFLIMLGTCPFRTITAMLGSDVHNTIYECRVYIRGLVYLLDPSTFNSYTVLVSSNFFSLGLENDNRIPYRTVFILR